MTSARRLPDHVRTSRRIEPAELPIDLPVQLDVEELDRRDLAQAVDELETPGDQSVERDQHRAEIGPFELGLEQHGPQLAVGDLVDDGEAFAYRPVAAEEHRRRRRGGVVERRDGDLLELDVVDPDVLAVGDDELLEGLAVMPTKAARTLQHERPGLPLGEPAVRAEKLLLESGLERIDLVEKTIEHRGSEHRDALVRIVRLRDGGKRNGEHGEKQSERGARGHALNREAAEARGPP